MKITILALIGILICKNVEGQCREHVTNVNNGNRVSPEAFWNVYTATSCSAKCRTKSWCQEWIWHHEGSGKWAFQCVLTRGHLGSSKVFNSDTILGDRNCE